MAVYGLLQPSCLLLELREHIEAVTREIDGLVKQSSFASIHQERIDLDRDVLAKGLRLTYTLRELIQKKEK